MLCGVSLSFTPGVLPGASAATAQTIGLITGISGMGASRKAVDNIFNGVPSGWALRLFSCISMLKPFSVSIVFNSNDIVWLTNIQALPGAILITWPPESGYSTGGTLGFTGGMTDFSFGAADIENRVEGSLTISPSGVPVVTPGTHP